MVNGDALSPSYLGNGEVNASLDRHWESVHYCRSCCAHDLILGIRAAGTANRADNIALVDEWNAASRGNHSIEREQIIEVHQLDTVLEDLRWPPKGHGCSRLVLRNLNRGEHRAVHALEGNQVAAGVGYCYVHFPISPSGLGDSGVDDRLRLLQRYRTPVRHIEWNFVWDDIERIRRGPRLSRNFGYVAGHKFPPRGYKVIFEDGLEMGILVEPAA
jgi:hypothetical protein